MKRITKTEFIALVSAGALSATVFAAAVCPAFAGGYVAPVVQPQISYTVEHEHPTFSWSGFYAGGTIGKQSVDLKRTRDEFRDRYFKSRKGYDDTEISKAEYDSLGYWKAEHGNTGWDIHHVSEHVATIREVLDDSDTTYGIFAGYRHQFGNRVVAGAEASYTRTGKLFEDSRAIETWAVEGQLGYAVGRALPYAAAGYAQVAGEDALSVSLGLDYAITDRVIIGAKYTRYDVGEVKGIDSIKGFEADSDLVSLRAAIKF